MNPFILLVKPAMAVGAFVAKFVVAAGMVAADGREADVAPMVDTEIAIVRVGVSPEDRRLAYMEVELPNGEFYALPDAVAGDAAPPPVPQPAVTRRPGGKPFGRTHTHVTRSPTTIAMLQSETGRSMRCDVSLPSDADGGSGVCTTDAGQKYEFSFALEPRA